MSRSERMAVLDEALGEGYEDFDGMIIAERARAQQQSNAAGPAGSSGDDGQSGTGSGGSRAGSGAGERSGEGAGRGGQRPPMPGSTGPEGGQVIARGGAEDGAPQAGGSGGSTGGLRGGPAGEASDAETYPVPDDIPEGRDDDVVARQIREAAMTEPDPELREALWDEYRRYTGLEE